MIIFVPNKTACKTFDDKKVCQKFFFLSTFEDSSSWI